jgi:hypothetical protein
LVAAGLDAFHGSGTDQHGVNDPLIGWLREITEATGAQRAAIPNVHDRLSSYAPSASESAKA